MNNGKTNLPAVIETAISEQKINPANVNLILPTQTFDQVIGEFDKVTIEVVIVDPEDTYEASKGKKPWANGLYSRFQTPLGLFGTLKPQGLLNPQKGSQGQKRLEP